MDVPTLLYSPDGPTYNSDIFYPILTSFVCPSYKSYCTGETPDFLTRYEIQGPGLKRTQDRCAGPLRF